MVKDTEREKKKKREVGICREKQEREREEDIDRERGWESMGEERKIRVSKRKGGRGRETQSRTNLEREKFR